MRSSRPRAPATPGNGDGDDDGAHRKPFRPLQLRTASRSPNPRNLPTPPREVILTPRATPKPVKRRASSQMKRPATKIKSEPPEIDLSKVRPPSPSDDPLLLSGPRSTPCRARFTPPFSSSPSGSTCFDLPVSFAARLTGTRIGALESSPDTTTHALHMFDAPRIVEETSGAWSDSDSDEFNLTGEYTGKYRLLKVPTKADPPTSATRERIESWGRPVSPFPYSEIMERSLPEDASGHVDILDSMKPCENADIWEAATEPPLSDVEPSPPPSVSEDEFADYDLPVLDEEQEEEAQIDRELSVCIDDGSKGQPTNPMEGNSHSSDEEDDVEGEDIVKITSEDPKAAARAAAILRMHDYDCILAAEKKRSRSTKSMRKRRKTIENAGITKSYTDLKRLQSSKASPGSLSLPLLELWQDAEDSVFLEHHSMSYCDTTFMLSPLKATAIHPKPFLPPPTAEWTRDCWKCLDKCLVAERLAVAAACGLGTNVFADTGDISKDAVLDRFMNQLDGESVRTGLGLEWSRDNLLLRLDVLIKKQSRHQTRAPSQDSHGTTELRYRGLLKEAMALSGTMERCPTSVSTVVAEPRDLWSLQSSLRGAIRTPSRTPDPRLPHPKDQIYLRHASLPQKSMIPVPIRPKRLVDLRHLSPTKSDRGASRPTARRSSGCSVKDLVKQYEGLDK